MAVFAGLMMNPHALKLIIPRSKCRYKCSIRTSLVYQYILYSSLQSVIRIALAIKKGPVTKTLGEKSISATLCNLIVDKASMAVFFLIICLRICTSYYFFLICLTLIKNICKWDKYMSGDSVGKVICSYS